MLETLLKVCGVALTAAITENAVFTRALGDGALRYNRFTPSQALVQGVVMTLASMVAALAGWMGEEFITSYYSMPVHLRPPVYLAIFCAFYAVIYLLLQIPKLRGIKKQLPMHPAVVFGYIPMATMLLIGYGAYSLGEAFAYGFGVGVGYLLAMLLTYIMRERSWFLRAPTAFQGLPLALMYTGLVSLALFGLLGHQPAI